MTHTTHIEKQSYLAIQCNIRILKLPALHNEHPGCPSVSWYDPGKQYEHEVELNVDENDPTGQGEQAAKHNNT